MSMKSFYVSTPACSSRLALVILLALGCGESEPETPPPAEATAEATTTTVTTPTAAEQVADAIQGVLARLGGTRVLAGNMVVEVLPSADGEIVGIVSKADGEAAEISKLVVKVQGEDGETKEVELVWDDEQNVYIGQAETPIQQGPVHVTVEAEGQSLEADIEAVAVAPAARYGGQVVVVGDVAAEVRVDPQGVIQVVTIGGATLDENATITVSVPTDSGEVADVPLVYNADAGAYLGSVSEGVTLAPGAVGLEISRGEELLTTRVQTVPVKQPEHEGDVVVAGDYSVELKPTEGDAMQAWVYDAEGNAVTDANLSMQLAAGTDAVNLVWNAETSMYVAVVPPSVDVTAAPVRVRVRRGRRVHRGGIAASAAPAFGRGWRARVDAGSGGAIPPGQATRIVTVVDVRADPGVRGAMARVRVRPRRGVGMRMRMGMGMGGPVRVRVNSPGARVVGMGAMGGVRVQTMGGNVRVQAPGGAVRVNVPGMRPALMVQGPRVPMVRVGGSAMGMASGMRGGGMASGMASFMIGR